LERAVDDGNYNDGTGVEQGIKHWEGERAKLLLLPPPHESSLPTPQLLRAEDFCPSVETIDYECIC